MHHLHSLESIDLDASWITIGSFDGVHHGHQALVRELVRQAHNAGAPAVAITFYPHPAVVLRDLQGPYYLTTPQERAVLLGDLGVDFIITLPFDRALAGLTALEFMQRLAEHIKPVALFVGPDFTLGRNREGNLERLREIGKELNYSVHIVEPARNGGQIVSSSQVRRALLEGDVAGAAALLGRWYAVTGAVVPGDHRGRSIGIPTANLEVPPQRILPASGVYATWVRRDDQRLPSATNVGVRPTFENQPGLPRVETHLLDFDQDLYGAQLQVEFVERIRPEQRFSSVEALLEQIRLDIARSREVLAHAR